MWAGMNGTDYELVKFGAIHHPTRLRLQIGGTSPDGREREFLLLRTGDLKAGSVTLHIRRDPTRGRAMDMSISTWPDFDEEGFRRLYGRIDILGQVVLGDGARPLRWSLELADTVATLFFVLSDPSGFRSESHAYPDVLHISAPDLPEAVRRSIRNKFAQTAA